MDIYSMGEEKCIDGVWGRELAGRFYTHSYNLYMCRLLNIHHPSKQWLTYVCPDGFELLDWYTIESSRQPIPYIPKHIKGLTNLKRGDIVWVNSSTSFNTEAWSPVVYLSTLTDSGGFYCNEVFTGRGVGLGCTGRTYKEVFLKPPFDF